MRIARLPRDVDVLGAERVGLTVATHQLVEGVDVVHASEDTECEVGLDEE